MKTTLAILILVHAALSASAQTNEPAATNRVRVVAAPVNPGIIVLANIERERAQLEQKNADINNKAKEATRLLELQYAAKKFNFTTLSRSVGAISRKREADVLPIQKRVAELQLKEYEIRNTYNLENWHPESKTAKKKK